MAKNLNKNEFLLSYYLTVFLQLGDADKKEVLHNLKSIADDPETIHTTQYFTNQKRSVNPTVNIKLVFKKPEPLTAILKEDNFSQLFYFYTMKVKERLEVWQAYKKFERAFQKANHTNVNETQHHLEGFAYYALTKLNTQGREYWVDYYQRLGFGTSTYNHEENKENYILNVRFANADALSTFIKDTQNQASTKRLQDSFYNLVFDSLKKDGFNLSNYHKR